MKKAGRKKNFHFGIFEVKKWEKVGKLRIGGYAAGLPVCGTAKTQRKRGLLRPRQINRASYTARVGEGPRCRVCAFSPEGATEYSRG